MLKMEKLIEIGTRLGYEGVKKNWVKEQQALVKTDKRD